ncbi:hypothetical protein J7K50_02235 [bacterium]|nr:hypothetical protein [bacterium]
MSVNAWRNGQQPRRRVKRYTVKEVARNTVKRAVRLRTRLAAKRQETDELLGRIQGWIKLCRLDRLNQDDIPGTPAGGFGMFGNPLLNACSAPGCAIPGAGRPVE